MTDRHRQILGWIAVGFSTLIACFWAFWRIIENFHGKNVGGAWDAQKAKASYQKMPDKESPLWDIYSKVIYWWTETESDDKNAYIVVYNGQVWPRPKKAYWGYLGFRAVKTATEKGDNHESQKN